MPNDLPDWRKLGQVAVQVNVIQGSPGGTVVLGNLPPQALGIMVVAAAVDANSHVVIQGVVSNKTYMDVLPTAIGQVFTAQNLDNRDFQQGGIRITVSNAVTTIIDLYYLCAGVVLPVNSLDTQVFVSAAIRGIPQADVTDRAARLLGHVTVDSAAGVDVSDRLARQEGRVVLVSPGNFNIILDDQGGGVVNLGVSHLNARPANWQAPNQNPLGIGSVIAAGGVLTLVGSVVGQTVRIFSCSLAVDAVLATGTINLEDTGNTIRHQFSTSTSPCNPFLSEGGAAALPVSLGVQLRNPSGSPQTVRGSLVYSQN